MNKPKILVARRLFPEVLARLREHFDIESNEGDTPWTPAELAARLPGVQGLFIAGTDTVDAALLAAGPELRIVATMTVGYNHIDVAACTARGVLVTNAPDVLTETTADFGFALMMAAARRITEGERYLRAGRWRHWSVDLLAGQDVFGATLGILGMGRIGQAIARRGHLGFGMKVVYHNRSRLAPELEAPLGARWVEKDELMAQTDHLVIVLPYSPATHYTVGARELALMKPTATLTNIARGGIVDDAALAEALKAGRIAAAGLDVFEGEPRVHSALLELPNVALTPHIASASVPTRVAMAMLAVDNLVAAFDGRTPPTLLNPDALSKR
ncbi:MAG: D-glycerate dehydrogenase [Paucibacter sp.]|nr:D-glycerate dehydrogenase [Roseateles sp.]